MEEDDDEFEVGGELVLDGRVVDLDRAPVEGARVWLSKSQSTTTSSDGRFSFHRLVAGLHRIQARKHDLGCEIELLTLRSSRTVELVVASGATLHLTVTDGIAPIANATVERDDEVVATSDERGIAVVHGLGERFQMVEVSAPGYAPAFVSMTLASDSGGTIERAVTLHRGVSLSGVVVGPGGVRIPDATIRVWGEWGAETTSDANGAWQFESIAPGEYQLSAFSKHRRISKTTVIALDASRSDVVIESFAGGRIRGTVTTADGGSAAGAFVALINSDEEHPATSASRCDENGDVEIRVEPGNFNLFAHRDCVLASPMHHVAVHDEEIVDVNLVMVPSSIAGAVVDETGRPVEGAEVRVRADFLRADLTDVAGRFALGAFPPGEYQVSVSRTRNYDFAPGVSVGVTAGTSDLRVVLPSTGTVTGRVEFDGVPSQRFAVLVTRCPQFPFIGQPINVRSAEGRFRFEGVRPGPWGLVLAAPGTALHTLSKVDVVSSETVDVGTITLDRGQRISGTVRDSNGDVVAGARVTIGNRDMDGRVHLDPSQRWFSSTFEVMTNDDGTFLFDGVTSLRAPNARPSPLVASHPARGTSVAVATPDGDAVVELVLVACGTIEGDIANYEGRFVSVTAHRKGEQADVRMASVSKAGAFRIEDITPGEYRIQVIMLPGTPTPEPVDIVVVAGQVTAVRLALPA